MLSVEWMVITCISLGIPQDLVVDTTDRIFFGFFHFLASKNSPVEKLRMTILAALRNVYYFDTTTPEVINTTYNREHFAHSTDQPTVRRSIEHTVLQKTTRQIDIVCFVGGFHCMVCVLSCAEFFFLQFFSDIYSLWVSKKPKWRRKRSTVLQEKKNLVVQNKHCRHFHKKMLQRKLVMASLVV